MQVTRGVSRRDHAFPTKPVPPAIVVTCRRTPPYPKSPDSWAGAAITTPDQRWDRCDIKSVGLLANVLAKQAARQAGAVEAIMIGRDSTVTEGASTTVWVVTADGTLCTRQLSHSILPGCTRASLMEQMAASGISAQERAVSEAELRDAREIFITSATSFVKPLTKLDGKPVGDGTVGRSRGSCSRCSRNMSKAEQILVISGLAPSLRGAPKLASATPSSKYGVRGQDLCA